MRGYQQTLCTLHINHKNWDASETGMEMNGVCLHMYISPPASQSTHVMYIYMIFIASPNLVPGVSQVQAFDLSSREMGLVGHQMDFSSNERGCVSQVLV